MSLTHLPAVARYWVAVNLDAGTSIYKGLHTVHGMCVYIYILIHIWGKSLYEPIYMHFFVCAYVYIEVQVQIYIYKCYHLEHAQWGAIRADPFDCQFSCIDCCWFVCVAAQFATPNARTSRERGSVLRCNCNPETTSWVVEAATIFRTKCPLFGMTPRI